MPFILEDHNLKFKLYLSLEIKNQWERENEKKLERENQETFFSWNYQLKELTESYGFCYIYSDYLTDKHN